MMVQTSKKREANFSLPKYGGIFLFLAVFVLLYVLHDMYLQERRTCPFEKSESKHEVNSTMITPEVLTDPYMHHGFCTFKPLTTKDAEEKDLILDSIAWPETTAMVSLEQTSDPAHSSFTLLPKKGGGPWRVGDQLEVMIKMYDFRGQAKQAGGDVLLSRLHNQELGAGVAGKMEDRLDGSYSAVFSLLWEGSAEVEVTLVHPSEAVTVLRRMSREHPDRTYFQNIFRSGSVSEKTACSVCLHPTEQPLCNYTDLRTGEPYFCYKPKKLSCDARVANSAGVFRSYFKDKEDQLFQSNVNMKVSIKASGPANVTVLPKTAEVINSDVKSGPVGYYYKGNWRALRGAQVQQFTTSNIGDCLRGMQVHLYGDSTIRQWFEYLMKAVPGLIKFDLHSGDMSGPLMAIHHAHNILVTYRCHGPPISFDIPISQLRYVANELDGLTGGRSTAVVIGVWAHFSTFPIELYIRRLQSIRRAVVRLLKRAPDTVVIIRTANPKIVKIDRALIFSDWYCLQRDKALRAIFKGLNVHLVDAWEMVLAHDLPHNVHPQRPIIKNMIDVILSNICP